MKIRKHYSDMERRRTILPSQGVKKKKQIAAERLDRVRELQKQGMTAPKIAEQLGVSLPTIWQDFCKLKRERERDSVDV